MYIVIAKSEKYPDLMLMMSNVMSQWGNPLKFNTKDEARGAASEWAEVFQNPDRRVVVRRVEDSAAVPHPGASAPRRTIIRRK